VSLRFRLVGAADIGVFKLISTSWDFAESLRAMQAQDSILSRGVRAVLSINASCITTRSGTVVKFVCPQVIVSERASEGSRALLRLAA
jgi:hypothetical protein